MQLQLYGEKIWVLKQPDHVLVSRTVNISNLWETTNV
jgi:hypothetical protein